MAHDPQAANPRSLKDSLLTGATQALSSLRECLEDLTDQQAWARPLPDRHSIATIVMHLPEGWPTQHYH